jgi:hypothetical protein
LVYSQHVGLELMLLTQVLSFQAALTPGITWPIFTFTARPGGEIAG